MKSGLRRLLNRSTTPPVRLATSAFGSHGLSFNLGVGRGDRETYMRQYGMSGTVYGIVSLLAEASATPSWKLYRKAPQDGRVRYTTADRGTDQRIQVVQHQAIKLWDCPNALQSGFEFREGAQLHEELTGETYWVVDCENALNIPTSIWLVRPDRMQPTIDEYGALSGWIYTGPSGEQVPLKLTEVILEKRPDPLDPYRGLGPVQAILPNIQQQRYATEYQRNLFLNGAQPGGIITVPGKLNDQEFDEMVDRWRESHRGVARAGHVGVLEAGATWTPGAVSNQDMQYGELRQANRDELREAWRVHKAMMGNADDVNRANAQTAEETFVAWQVIPRLNRRRDTLNSKLLPMFGVTGENVEFDYDDPSPENAEAAADELVKKATAAKTLIDAGFDPADVCEVVGLPDMDCVEVQPPALAQSPVAPQTADQTQQAVTPTARASVTLRNNGAAAKVYEIAAEDYPASAIAWMHHAHWKGPVNVPLGHVDWEPDGMEGNDPDHVQDFVKKLKAGKKLKPVILVKTPGSDKLYLADGHHRYLASAEMGKPVRAYVATVNQTHGGWETMHSAQQKTRPGNAATLSKAAVNYRDATDPKRECGNCEMFRAPHGCTLVKGRIEPDDVCDRWVAKATGNKLVTVDAAELLYRMLSNGSGSVPIETGVTH